MNSSIILFDILLSYSFISETLPSGVNIILASRAVNVNSNNANFNVRNVNNGNVDANNLFNSNGNSNNNNYGVRPVASINCGYAINDCI